MKASKRAITNSDIRAFLKECGWEQDRYDNMKKTITSQKDPSVSRTYRVKFNAISVRIEVEVIHAATKYSPKSKSWVKIGGDYVKNITIDGDVLKIGNKIIKKK